MNALYKIIRFSVKHGNCGGSLVQFQAGDSEINALPFEIGKVLIMSDIRTDDVRGNHAHYETEEILVALSGGCTVDLDDGCGTRESVRIGSGDSVLGTGSQQPATSNSTFAVPKNHQPSTINCEEIKALLLFPHIWRIMRNFEPGTTLMVVANIRYDEKDYIRDRTEFERVSKDWKILGGSAV